MKLKTTIISCSRVAQSKHTCETAEHSRQLLSWLLQEER